MHVLFVHQNFPAQFGLVAEHLTRRHGYRSTFVSEKPAGRVGNIELIQYRVQGGATAKNHYCSRTFENAIVHTHGVYEALKARPDIKPDLIVGHSGFGSTLFLRELYPDTPILNYFEFFYQATGSDLDFRPDFPSDEMQRLRSRARNAMFLLDLNNCDTGYTPTHWQWGVFPAEYRNKLRVVFDGIDTDLWKPQPVPARRVAGHVIPHGTQVVSYAARGMESMRGFDIFMRMAKKLGDRRKDVLFVIAGQDRQAYSGDENVTGTKSFREWVLARDNYDLSRFLFLGLIPPQELARLFCLTDLHVYLTVPFVLSWSVLNALACGATVLASDTGPVREVIGHGRNGLLTDFFDVDAMADAAGRVLDSPADYKHLGLAGVELVRERYSLDVCLPQMVELYQHALSSYRGSKSSKNV